jgi:hypothetical protein
MIAHIGSRSRTRSRGRRLSTRGLPDDLERAQDLMDQAHGAAVSHGYAAVARRATAALSNRTDAAELPYTPYNLGTHPDVSHHVPALLGRAMMKQDL